MKTRYIFILSFLIIILTSSYVSAIDNDSNLIKEVNFNKINLDNNQSDLNVSDKENYSSNASLTNGSSSDSSSATDNAYKEPTKKQRTFKIGKFKAVLSKKQYKKLFLIRSTEKLFLKLGYDSFDHNKFKGYKVDDDGLCYSAIVKTNKFIKIKFKSKNKVKYKKIRIGMEFTYRSSSFERLRNGHVVKLVLYPDKYNDVTLIGKNAKNYAKYFYKCKYGKDFTKLKKSKLIKSSKVFQSFIFVVWGV